MYRVFQISLGPGSEPAWDMFIGVDSRSPAGEQGQRTPFLQVQDFPFHYRAMQKVEKATPLVCPRLFWDCSQKLSKPMYLTFFLLELTVEFAPNMAKDRAILSEGRTAAKVQTPE